MNRTRSYLVFLALMFCLAQTYAQQAFEPEKAGKIEDGRFVLTINPNWNEMQFARLAALFDLDSLIVQALRNNQLGSIHDSTGWKTGINQAGLPELSRLLEAHATTNVDKILFTAMPQPSQASTIVSMPAVYGVNDFSSLASFSYQNGIACFTLTGFNRASSVILSGSFNQWSTMQLPMERTRDGWSICIPLEPGKYHYKYIVDGRWTTDPSNRKRERDGHRGYNSVVYAYNYTFKLGGHTNARRVILAGSFNNFNPRELSMTKTADGWELPLYLREGTHAYKFIIDGNWITDPANPISRNDGRGNVNSFMALGDTMYFRLAGFHEADRVFLAGTFNAWNTGELQMNKTDAGWELPYVLAPGNYEYKYIVDGEWMPDPGNPFRAGEGDYTNSFMAYRPNHTFILQGFPDAKSVMVSGSFNRWNRSGYVMARKDDHWEFSITLDPGRHSYKFIVDGVWMMDPDNPLWEENEFRGDGNSVLWIE